MQERDQSEVTRLMQEIDLECQAARLAMNGYAEVAKHEAITARMENVGRLHDALSEMIGEEQAVEALVKAMEKS